VNWSRTGRRLSRAMRSARASR